MKNKILPFGVSRLVIKFLLVMLPVFILLTTVGLSHFTDKNTRDARDRLNARLGSQIAMMAASLEQNLQTGGANSSQQMLNMLLTDRAIDCAELTKISTGSITLKSPQNLGCRGADPKHQIKIPVGENSRHVLKIFYNDNEVIAVARAQQELSNLAILAGIAVAIIASAFGFGVIVGRPLQTLLSNINTFSSDGEVTLVQNPAKDELGKVILAFNSMQKKLSQKTDTLEKMIVQQQDTEDNLRVSNNRLELAQQFLQEQLDQIDHQRIDQQTILDNMPHSIIWVDRDHNIRMLSKRVAEVLSISEKQFQHVRSLHDLITILAHRKDLGPYKNDAELSVLVDDHIDMLCSEQDINKVLRIELLSQNNCLHVQVAQLPDGGCIIGQHDITDQVAAETELNKARNGLQRANSDLEKRVDARTRDLVKAQKALLSNERDATYGKLVSKICHEIRNPLNALNVSLFVIKSKMENNPKLDKTFARSERTIQRCSEILTDFHEFAMTRELNFQPVEICNWVQNKCDLFPAPRGIFIQTNISRSPTLCNIDVERFGNALNKVLANATQALQDPECTAPRKTVKVEVKVLGNRVKLVITDNGIGMNKKIASESLQPLFSTRGFGVGLGLPIAVQNLQSHGGSLRLTSKPGTGTTITMYLPIAEQIRQVA